MQTILKLGHVSPPYMKHKWYLTIAQSTPIYTVRLNTRHCELFHPVIPTRGSLLPPSLLSNLHSVSVSNNHVVTYVTKTRADKTQSIVNGTN